MPPASNVISMGAAYLQVVTSQSVSYFTVPPRAHPSTASTGSQSGSAAPDLTLVLALGGYSIVASEVNLSQRTGCSLSLFALNC